MSDFETVPARDVPEGASILDVREEYEWAAGHVEGALHIPLEQLPERLEELDADEDLFIICRTCVAGGMDMWFEAGRPMVSDNGLKPVVL